MYGTQSIVVTMTSEQFSEMLTSVVDKALKNHIPPIEQPALSEYPSRKETKEYLGVSYSTLNLWSKDTADRPAILVPRKIGSRVRYHRDDVFAAMKESRRFRSTASRVG